MPMISAAMSWSRMAMKARPIRLRTRFMVPTIASTTKNEQEEVHLRSGWRSSWPKRLGRGTSIEACTPPLIHVTWLMIHSMMSWPASVAMAR